MAIDPVSDYSDEKKLDGTDQDLADEIVEETAEGIQSAANAVGATEVGEKAVQKIIAHGDGDDVEEALESQLEAETKHRSDQY